MRKMFLFLSLTFIAAKSFSQTNIQAYGSFIRNLNPDFGGNTQGAGFRFEFGKDESSVSYYAGLAYALPISTKKELEARAYSNFTSPSTVEVTGLYKLPMYRLEGGARYYITGEAHNYEGINFYLNLGAEVIAVPNKPKYSYYDKEYYTLGFTPESDVNEDGTEKLALNIMLAGGAGIEKNIGPGNLFAQITLAFPATQNGNSDISSSLEEFTPIPLNFNIGYKISLSRSE
jgi:hypothetical protein